MGRERMVNTNHYPLLQETKTAQVADRLEANNRAFRARFRRTYPEGLTSLSRLRREIGLGAFRVHGSRAAQGHKWSGCHQKEKEDHQALPDNGKLSNRDKGAGVDIIGKVDLLHLNRHILILPRARQDVSSF